MSGRKTSYTRISVDELARLRRQANSAATLAGSNRAMEALARSTDAFMRQQQDRINQLNDTIDSLNRTVSNQNAAASKECQQLRAQLQATIRNTNQALQEMAARNQQELNTLNREFQQGLARNQADTIRMIDESNRRMEQALTTAVSSLEQEIGSVSSRMNQVERELEETARQLGIMVHSDAALLEMAREYADTARLLNDDSANSFRTELLLPGRLAAARGLLRQADQDIADAAGDLPTNASVARQNARAAVEEALRLHEDLVRAEQVWQAHYQAAQQALNTAEAQRVASSRLQLDNDGQPLEVDVDHWSNGDLSALDDRIAALRQQLEQADGLSLSDLDGIRQAGVQVAHEILEASEFATVAFYASQDRADIAQDVADHMWDALALAIQSDGYQGDDQRGAHRIHLKNPDTGFEMVVTQIPELDENGGLGNRLESDILDYGTNNRQEGDRIAYEALQALADLDFCQEPVRTVQGYEDRPSERREQADRARWDREPVIVPRPVHTLVSKPGAQTTVS